MHSPYRIFLLDELTRLVALVLVWAVVAALVVWGGEPLRTDDLTPDERHDIQPWPGVEQDPPRYKKRGHLP